MEQYKYLPPKFSESLKDLTKFLGIENLTEEQLRLKREDMSDTSSNVSLYTQSAFKAKKNLLDVIAEKKNPKEDEEEEAESARKQEKIVNEKNFQSQDISEVKQRLDEEAR